MSKLYTEAEPKTEMVAATVLGEPVGIVRTVGGFPDESEHTVHWLCKYKDLKDGDYLYVAQQQELLKDKARLDWLADVNNNIGNVQLPREIVERNLDSLRASIDEAMIIDMTLRKDV